MNELNKVSADFSANYNDVLVGMFAAFKVLLKNSFTVFEAQMKVSVKKIKRHMVQLIVLSALMVIATAPLVFAAAWGLGILLDDQFWLSALIIGSAATLTISYLIWKTQKKLKQDFDMDLVERNLQNTSEALLKAMTEIKEAIAGTAR